MGKHSWNDQWIIENFNRYKVTKDLHSDYLKQNSGQMSYDMFKWHCREVLGLSREKFIMSQEQEQFIRKHFNAMTVENLRKLFNKTFGTKFKTTAFHYHTKRLGLDKWKEHQYTEEQERFLKDNAPVTRRRELTKKFNEHFNASLKVDTLEMHCWQRGLKALDDGRFSHDRIFTIFIDGNPDNLEQSNIRNVDFFTYSWIKNNGWLNSGAELLDTAIQWCELMRLMKRNQIDNNPWLRPRGVI